MATARNMRLGILLVVFGVLCPTGYAQVEHYDLQLEHACLEPDGRIQVGFECRDGEIGRQWVTGVPLLMRHNAPRIRGDLSALKVTADGIRGELKINRISMATGELAHKLTPLTIDVRRTGAALGGSWSSKFGKKGGDGTFGGAAMGRQDADGVWNVRIDPFATSRGKLDLSFTTDNGELAGFRAVHRGWSQTSAIVDASDLKLAGNRLAGKLVVTLMPDGWNPPEYYPIHCEAALDLSLKDGQAVGRATGLRGLPIVWSGKIVGRVYGHDAWVKRNRVAKGGPDWPTWQGPGGDFNPREYGVALRDSFKDAWLVWRSEEETPASRGSTATKQRAFQHGGGGSPVVRDGRVYLFYSTPSKQVPKGANQHAGGAGLTSNDEMLCMDAATGETLWKTVVPEAGPFQVTGKHSIGNLTPVVVQGTVAALDSGGFLVGFDVNTGKRLWRSPVIKTAKPFVHRPISAAGHAGVIFTGGYVHGQDILLAFDAADGALLWRRPNTIRTGPAPKVWSKGGTDYVIGHNAKGEVTCLEARTGKEAWKFGGIVPTTATLHLHGDYLLAPVVSANPAQAGRGETELERLGCWRVSPTQAKPLWVTSAESVFSDEYMNQMPIGTWRGRVYYRHDGQFHCLDLKTGRHVASGASGPAVLYRHTWPLDAGRVSFWEGRMVCVSNYSHDSGNMSTDMYQSRKLIVLDPDPRNIRFIEAVMLPNKRFSTYDQGSPTVALVDGRLFVRGDDGVYCYDLRRGRP